MPNTVADKFPGLANSSQPRVLKTIFLPVMPWSVSGEDSEDQKFGGILGKMLNLLSRKLNIKFETIESHDWTSFAKNDGKWNGVMKKLQDQEYDLLVGPLMVSSSHVDDFHLLPPYYQIPSYLTLASASEHKITNFFAFLMTFQIEVWYGIACTLIAVILVSTWSDSLWNRRHRTNKGFVQSFSYFFWIYFAALFSEGSPRTLPSTRNRIILAIWLLAMIVISHHFSAELEAILLVSHGAPTMKNVHDLASKPKLLIQMPDYYAMPQCFRDTNLEAYKTIWKTVHKHGVEKSIFPYSEFHELEIYQRVKNGTAVIIADPTVLKMNYAEVCHQLRGTRTVYYFEGVCSIVLFAFIAAPGMEESLYRTLKKRIRWMMEGHLIEKWVEHESRDLWKCLIKPHHNEAAPFSVDNLFGAFVLLFAVQFGAACTLVWEIVRHKLDQRQLQRQLTTTTRQRPKIS